MTTTDFERKPKRRSSMKREIHAWSVSVTQCVAMRQIEVSVPGISMPKKSRRWSGLKHVPINLVVKRTKFV